MPSKRVRKDSEHSIGSSGTPSTSGLGNGDASAGAGSSSSGSIGDESENAVLKSCCFPNGCTFGEDNLCDENMMVKVICSFESCSYSQFMHTQCFNSWEETLLSFLRSHGRARSWSEKQRRQNLWTKKGYDLVFRACLCKCKHGYLKKDIDWTPQVSGDDSANKKKTKKKTKDLPTLGNYSGLIAKSKSKPIPNSKDSRIRHSSASSIVSVDQGYISASPGASETCPSVFSPPSYSHQYRGFFGIYSTGNPSLRGTASFHAPSTSPLPEIPDDNIPSSPQFVPSPNSTDISPLSPNTEVFLSPVHPVDRNNTTCIESVISSSISNHSEYHGIQSASNEQTKSDIQAMSAYIQNVMQQGERSPSCASVPSNSYAGALYQGLVTSENEQDINQFLQNKETFTQRQISERLASAANSFPPSSVANNQPVCSSMIEELHRRGVLANNWCDGLMNDMASVPGTNARILMALRQKEKQEIERREMSKLLMNVRNDRIIQGFPASGIRSRHSSHTEIRLVPMRCTNFAKRFDFSEFQKILARQHVNPYHIKMEGEGYGSDDLRNFILASLSKEKCSQMNCVVCGIDLPVYDHFPLVDGTMFLSPEKNERSTKNCFKIKVEGKYEFVHAVCMRCMEGLHNIVCRLCNARWEGTHHQLGTLYMFDIFAASPCCQKRLCCKQCGNVIVDIRQGLNHFSDYSVQQACPLCHSLDHHFVHPVTTYQLIGLVYS